MGTVLSFVSFVLPKKKEPFPRSGILRPLSSSHHIRVLSKNAALVARVKQELEPDYRISCNSSPQISTKSAATPPDLFITDQHPPPENGPTILLDSQYANHFAHSPLSDSVLDVLPTDWAAGTLKHAARRSLELSQLRKEVTSLRAYMQRRLDVLEAVNNLAAETTNLRSYDDVAKTIAKGLSRIIDVDIGATMLAMDDATGPVLHLHCHKPCAENLLRSTRDRAIEFLRLSTGKAVDENALSVTITGESTATNTTTPQNHTSPKCVAIKTHGTTIGVIVVYSHCEPEFSEEDNNLLSFFATQTADIALRLSARLHYERRRLSHMVDSMADGLVMTDLNSDEVLINPAARRMLTIDVDTPVAEQDVVDKLGFHPFDLVSASTSPAPLHEEIHVGEQSLYSIISPVRDESGKLVGAVIVLRDPTDAKDLARRQREFVSVVSHELRTPLTSITGALDIVLSVYAGRLSDKQRRYLQMARTSCTQLNMLVDDLVDVARSESGRMPIQLTQLALDELAHEVVESYRDSARSKSVRIRISTEDTNIRIIGDPDRLTQVLNNLLSNAIKFTPVGGDIEVAIFGPSVASDHVGISVVNTGTLIPEADRERIFGKFEQLEEISTRRVGGSGLGLAISRAIVEAHRGRIWVESHEGATKFVFTLPAAPQEDEISPDTMIQDNRTTPTDDGAATVLIVDDDVYSTYILKGILMAAGYRVELANNTETALGLARSTYPSLVVVDGTRDPTEALALVDIVKHDPDTRKTSVLVIATPSHKEHSLRLGADGFLERPINPSNFRDICTQLISQAGSSQPQRILVVDDDNDIRLICRTALENAGYEVREAEDGIAALSEAKQFRPDLLLLDVMMPRVDGFKTAESFRNNPSTSMTPIIFVSAKGETADKVRAFRIGAEDYIVKPFDAAELVARVSKALERRRRELGASPTTQLPGANEIEAEIDRRLAQPNQYAFCYLDLDNLKAFNDYYGYAKADGVIRQTGDLIRDVIAREGQQGDFIGHIAGDDFVLITQESRVDRICTAICSAFSRLVPLYYNSLDREKGYIETKDRYGVLRRFPIMSISLAAVTNIRGEIRTFSELSAAAAQGKKLAKSITGSAYVRNGKLIIGTSPHSVQERY